MIWVTHALSFVCGAMFAMNLRNVLERKGQRPIKEVKS
jgi:hypothetical protein